MASLEPTPLFTEVKIAARVATLAAEISGDYADRGELLLVGVLKGAFIFLTAAVAPLPTLCLGQIGALRPATATEALLRRAQARAHAHATGEAMRSRRLLDG
jgi:uracil phosphoribosyltransferase